MGSVSRQLRRVAGAEYLGKLNGATGTYGAHVVAVPEADWPEVSRTFVEHLGLTWNPLTTQIESHDWQAELYADVARFNRVLHNLATDVWTYISRGVFVQIPVAGATGSSTMPHKVNPIRFENAEANLELSCALLDTLSATLVTSRLQRDLTDSTTQRNIGPAFGHALLEKLVGPFKAITACVVPLPTTADPDGAAAQFVESTDLAPRLLPHLPVLGIPGWCAENADPRFYDDPRVFRAQSSPLRTRERGRREGVVAGCDDADNAALSLDRRAPLSPVPSPARGEG